MKRKKLTKRTEIFGYASQDRIPIEVMELRSQEH